jgi:hypothetical protein
MNGPAIWPLRRRAERLGRHRALPTVSESDMPPVRPASLPLPDLRASVPAPVPPGPDPEPGKIVECGFCRVTGPSSLIPEKAGLRRCYPDIDGCVQRSLAGVRPQTLLSSAELVMAVAAGDLEPLPEAQERALAAFNEATDAQDAAEGKDLSEDEEPQQAAEEAPAEAAEPAPAEAGPEDGGESE